MTYIPNFIENADEAFSILWNELAWEKRDGAPRREYWMNDFGAPYTYGNGAGVRTYEAGSWHPLILAVRHAMLDQKGIDLNCCFVNGYEDERQALGWHADDSPEMDDDQPITVVSLGAEREIWFREKGSKGQEAISKLLLGNGSMLVMHPGMQITHQHRIPQQKNKPCGPRLSMTFRGLILG